MGLGTFKESSGKDLQRIDHKVFLGNKACDIIE